MNNDCFNGGLPSIRRRRFGGLFCAVLLHAGAWYLIETQPATHTLARPRGPAPGEIIVRFYAPAPRRPDHVKGRGERRGIGRIAMATPKKPAAEQGGTPAVAQPEPKPVEAREAAPVPSRAGEAISPAIPDDASPFADSDKVKKVIAEIVAEDQRKGIATKTAFKPQRSAAAQAIGQALRPKCENDSDARAGNVQFKGLMKLPSLMLGAVSDKGCKW